MTWSKRGFYVMRKRERRRFSVSLPRWVWFLALLALLWIVGVTRAWSQSSGLSSNSRNGDLQTWEQLSRRFTQDLDAQSTLLRQALTELETSKASSEKSTLLLRQSLEANSSLKIYNEQLGTRLQERDEDLAGSYEEIDRLEKTNLRLIIALVIIGAAIVIRVILFFVIRR